MDSIHLGNNHADHRRLSEQFDDLDLAAPFHCSGVEPEQLALYIAICKQWPDSEDAFPKGKWASIQHLEQILAARITQAIKAANSGLTGSTG